MNTGSELPHPVLPRLEPPSYCATRAGQWVRLVRDYVKEVQFGEVHLTVHKGKVVEVRKIEKVRFDEG